MSQSFFSKPSSALSDVDEVKSRLNIVDVVSDVVRLQSAGSGSYKGLCPFHREKTPSFTVNEERQLWHCFGCQKGGDVFNFVMESEGVDFREALRILAERAGVVLRRRYASEAVSPDRKAALKEILNLSAAFYTKQLFSPVGKEALDYLHRRGFDDEVLRRYQIGFAPEGWRYLLNFLLKRGFSPGDIERTGMIVRKENRVAQDANDYYDRFRCRVMFPITDVLGQTIGFSGRIMPGNENEKTAKYINTPESPLYRKKEVLYGIYQAKQAMKETGSAVVVEGNADVVALSQAGVANAIAVSGTAMTEKHARIIARYAGEVKLFFDNDTAGEQAGIRSAGVCLRAGLTVKMIVVSGGKDAADLLLSDREKLLTAINEARPLMEILFARARKRYDLSTPGGQQRMVEMISPVIAAFVSAVDRDYYARELAVAAGVSQAVVEKEIELCRGRAVSEIGSDASAGASSSANGGKFADRLGVLVGAVLSAAAFSPEICRLIVGTLKGKEVAESNDVLAFLLKRAGENDFSLTKILEEELPEKVRQTLEKVLRGRRIFAADLSEEEAFKETKNLLRELEREYQRRRRALLVSRLAEAEKSGDKQLRESILRQLTKN